MSQITTRRIRKWITLGMTLLLITSLTAWFLQRESVPSQLVIATGLVDGLYYKVGTTIKAPLEKRIGRTVTVLETEGSQQNLELVLNGQADLAIVQGGSPNEDYAKHASAVAI